MKKTYTRTIIVSSGNDCVCVLIKTGLIEGNFVRVGQYDHHPPPTTPPTFILGEELIQY